jgi:hypothetical protein
MGWKGSSRRVRLAWIVVPAVALLVASCTGDDETTTSSLRVHFSSLEQAVDAGRVSQGLVDDVRSTGSATGIVTLESGPLQAALAAHTDDVQQALAAIRDGYGGVKGRIAQLAGGAIDVVESWAYLPTALVTFHSEQALLAAMNAPFVVGVTKPGRGEPMTAESLPLIHADQAVADGFGGAGAVVAVLDTGIDPTVDPEVFGDCSEGSTTCRIAGTGEFGADDQQADDDGHGTLMGQVILGVAPEADLLALDVYSRDPQDGLNYWYDEDVQAAFDQTLGLVAQGIPVRAINLSIGTSGRVTAGPCVSDPWSGGPNAYSSLFDEARSLGILPVVSAGNGGADGESGLAYPACTLGALSVGATYDAESGEGAWGWCDDATTAADQVTCFTNVSPDLSLFAPGAVITVGGTGWAGTSLSAAFVSGSVATLTGAHAEAPIGMVEAALTGSGPTVTEPRSGDKHRLDVTAALDSLATSPDPGGDVTPPVVTFSDPTSDVDLTPGIETAPVIVSWSGADEGGSIASYELWVNVNDNEEWTQLQLDSPTATSYVYTFDQGNYYTFAGRATDEAGNVGDWSYTGPWALPPPESSTSS